MFAQLGEELGEIRRAGPELCSECVGLRIAEMDAQRLNPRPVCGCPACLPGSPNEHARPAGTGAVHQRVGEPALAYAGLSGKQYQAPRAGEGGVQTGDESGQLAVAADKGAARSVRSSRRGLFWDLQDQCGVLGEDRALERPEPLPRLDPELLDEGRACVLVGLKRVRLPVAAIEREHQLGTHALPVRVLGDQELQLFHHLGMATESELRLDQLLQGSDPQVIQARDFRLGERLVGQVR